VTTSLDALVALKSKEEVIGEIIGFFNLLLKMLFLLLNQAEAKLQVSLKLSEKEG
jgi:hypothetical protein